MGEISAARLIVVAAIAAVALSVWVFCKTGDPDPAHQAPSPHKPRTRYAELVAARREVERRMEDMRQSHRANEFRSETLDHLRAIHAEIEVQLDALRKTEG